MNNPARNTTSPYGAMQYAHGLYYKKGAYDFVYFYKDGWQRSSKTWGEVLLAASEPTV